MRNCAAECIGTFVLIFGGCGGAVHIGSAGVAAAFGLSLLAMVYAVGPISGCRLDPAVTLGLVLANKFHPRRAPGYMIAQVVGAVVAAAVIYTALRPVEPEAQITTQALPTEQERRTGAASRTRRCRRGSEPARRIAAPPCAAPGVALAARR